MITFEEQFELFINKWCGDNKMHLSDTDENDGQLLREFVKENYISKQKVREAINKHSVHDCDCRNILECFEKINEELGL